jgi:hypothetical protein
MNKKLIDQVTNALILAGGDQLTAKMASVMAKTSVDIILENCITTYTFDDPDGTNSAYLDLDDLISDIKFWDDNSEIPWAIYTQFEPRDAVFFVKFVDGKPETTH